MAVVSPVRAVLQQSDIIQFSDIETVGLMENGRRTEEESPRDVEDKIFVAVGKKVKESKSTLLWALRNSRGKKICILHVHQPPLLIPFMGGKFPANKLDVEEVRAYRETEKQKMHKILDDYLSICAQEGVLAEKLYIEMDDIGKGIVELVARLGIQKLVMGAAADKYYSKKMKMLKSKTALFVNKQAELFCHIWFVCNGCLMHTRDGSLEGIEIGAASLSLQPSPSTSTTVASQSKELRSRSLTHGQNDHVMLTNPVQDLIRRAISIKIGSHGGRVEALSSVEDDGGRMTPQSQLGAERSADEWEGIARRSPSRVSQDSTWSPTEVASTSDSISITGGERIDNGIVLPLEYRIEENLHLSSPLKELHVEEGRENGEMYEQLEQAMVEAQNAKREAFKESVRRQKAERDAIEAKRMAKASESFYATELKHRKELEEVLTREKQEVDKLKNQGHEVIEELRMARGQISVLENQIADFNLTVKELEGKIISAVELLITLKKERDDLQIECDNAVKETQELRKMREVEATSSQRPELFSKFSFLDIEEATRNLDPGLKIGEGGYGCVYKGFLHHTLVAIKMLHSQSLQGRFEFQQEVDVLSRVRHPNLVTLIGACPEAWALIYEYLPNGSLEDRLACKDNTPPLSWQYRIRIATEICSALIFLHSNKPHSIVHGDLKPANILLDSNLISKLGDFGICRLIPHREVSTNTTTVYHRTDPKGTFAYMDPELFATGELTPKSDVYSFGIILLQLLTGRPALGLVRQVQGALYHGTLNDLLDELAGDWPFVQATQLAHVALRCCEMNRKSRPDLVSEVWRVLEPMTSSCGSSSSFCMDSEENRRIPSYFICPIFQEVMQNPQMAADGFTYELEAIKGWLDSGHDTSPMTNLKLPHCNLLPNLALRSAIQEWLQQH